MDAVPRLLGLATAAPDVVLRQAEVRRWAAEVFGGFEAFERMLPVFDNAGIETRRTCVPFDWLSRAHGWKERNAQFVRHALPLLEETAVRCLAGAGLVLDDVDTLVVSSSTGIAVPSLDALLAERLAMRRDLQRVPLFGLGCAGGVLGLSRAARLARGEPGSRVLFLSVELCSLTFRPDDQSKSNVVAAALFGDGAAAALVSTEGAGPAWLGFAEHTFADSLDVMGWHVEDDGLGVLFSRDIPALVRKELRAAVGRFLGAHGLAVHDVARFACHPGGTKVLHAIEEALELRDGALDASRGVLRDYGNMSAPTALFVLERVLARGHGLGGGRDGATFLSAMGPGFTVALGLLAPSGA
jgi:alkylresorcinol/alkylpyrone synthase